MSKGVSREAWAKGCEGPDVEGGSAGGDQGYIAESRTPATSFLFVEDFKLFLFDFLGSCRATPIASNPVLTPCFLRGFGTGVVQTPASLVLWTDSVSPENVCLLRDQTSTVVRLNYEL